MPPKVEDSLIDIGKSLRPILMAMYDWGAGLMVSKDLEANCSMRRDLDEGAPHPRPVQSHFICTFSRILSFRIGYGRKCILVLLLFMFIIIV